MTKQPKSPAAALRDAFSRRDIANTRTCGCRYCDIGLQPFGGMHGVPGKGPVVCEVFWKRVSIRRRDGDGC